MSKRDALRRIDQDITTTGAAVTITVAGGGGAAKDADTVDGLHGSTVPQPGKLLALNAASQYPTSVINWAAVNHNALGSLTIGNPHTQYINAAGEGLTKSSQTLAVSWGATPSTIEPDDAAAAGTGVTAARIDHKHAIAAAAPTTSLSYSSTNAEGTSTSFSRADHTHAITAYSDASAYPQHLLKSDTSGDVKLHMLTASDRVRAALVDSPSGTGLSLSPAQDLSLSPGNTKRVKATSGVALQSDNYASQTTGWRVSYLGEGDFRYVYADELHVKAFITDLEQALAGGQIISKSVAILAADFTIPAKGASATLVVEDLPGTTAYVFATGDWVRIRNISRSGGGLVVADAYGTVTQVSQNGDGTQTYTFTRAAADTGSAVAGTVVQKGGLVLDYGVSGNGYWEVTTLDPAGSPYAQVATWAGHPQNLTVHARLGNLDGIAGIGAEWGLWAGKDSNHWVKITDQGAALKGVDQQWIDSSGNLRGEVNPEAGAEGFLFWLGPSGGDPRFVVTGDGTVYIGGVPSQNVAGWAHASDLTKIDGGDIYTGTVTADKVFVTGQNLLANGGFEFGSRGWTTGAGGPSIYDQPRTGTYHWWVAGDNATSYVATSGFIPVDGGATYWAEAWLKKYNGSGSAGLLIHQYDASKNWIADLYVYGTISDYYTRFAQPLTLTGTCCYVCITLHKHENFGAGSSVWWDDIVFRRMSENMLVVGNPSGARVEVNPAGIEGYSDATTKQFYLRTSDGRAMFGGGKGVLDADGLALDGAATSYHSFNAIRWLTQTDPAPGGDEVARIAAGRWGPYQWDSLYLDANPGKEIRTSEIVSKASSRRSSGDGSKEIRAYVGLTATPSPQAAAIFGAMIDPGEGSAWVDCYAFGSDSYVRIRTNGQERMRITHAGRVGIGTTSPGELLEVNGTTKSSKVVAYAASNPSVWVENENTNGRGGMEMESNLPIMNIGMNTGRAITEKGKDPSCGWMRIDLRSGYEGFHWFWEQTGSDTETEVFTIKHDGKVGIGDATPEEKLEVEGNVRATGIKTDGGGDGNVWRFGGAASTGDRACNRLVTIYIDGTAFSLLAVV